MKTIFTIAIIFGFTFSAYAKENFSTRDPGTIARLIESVCPLADNEDIAQEYEQITGLEAGCNGWRLKMASFAVSDIRFTKAACSFDGVIVRISFYPNIKNYQHLSFAAPKRVANEIQTFITLCGRY